MDLTIFFAKTRTGIWWKSPNIEKIKQVFRDPKPGPLGQDCLLYFHTQIPFNLLFFP
jgi:hypothetical protein